MKILILIPWFHPAYKAGGPIRSVESLIKEIDNGQLTIDNGKSLESGVRPSTPLRIEESKHYNFKIFTSNKDLDGTILNVPTDQWVDHSSNTKVWYSSTNDIIPVIKKEISEKKPDLFFIIGLYDWNYNFKPLRHFKDVTKIVSVRGMLHPGALSQKSFKKKVYLGIWKMLGLHKKVAFHATDEEEEVFVKKVFGENVEVKVAGNFPNSFSEFATLRKVKNELKLATVALISPMKNILEVVRAVGSLQSAVGSGQLAVGSWQVEYDIFGPVKDSEYWEKCKQVIDGMPANVKVSYHGPVSGEELELALINCHVFVLPSKSENYGHAIVEALSAGRPVITSENVPWKGLKDSHAGINVNMENENELSEAIRFFCEMDQDTLDEWSGGARRYFESRIDLEKIRREYEEMFK